MEVNYFTVLYWFCHTSTWIHHRYTRVPHSKPPSLLPPCTIPLGLSFILNLSIENNFSAFSLCLIFSVSMNWGKILIYGSLEGVSLWRSFHYSLNVPSDFDGRTGFNVNASHLFRVCWQLVSWKVLEPYTEGQGMGPDVR